MRATLIFHPVIRLLHRAEFEHAPAWQAPHAGLAVVAGACLQDLRQPFLDAGQLHRLAPENNAVLLLGQRCSQQKIAFAPASLATIEQDVRL